MHKATNFLYGMAKRVSTDEKLEKILEFFRKTSDFYSIKELEKLLPKNCPNVNSMLVPDLLKKLQDENLINVEKMGLSNIYWSFSSFSSSFQDTTELLWNGAL